MTRATSQWSDDAFLDMLRQQVDVAADECVAALHATGDFAALFQHLASNTSTVPADAPIPLRDFFDDTDLTLLLEADLARFPDGLDHARLHRAQRLFLDHAFTFCVVLLAKSLPEGYAAPCLSVLLNLSGNLRTQPYRRLLGVLQLVVDVTSLDGFDAGGRAVAAARQARLMHAGIRALMPRRLPGYAQSFGGPPVNLEDMLGTIMGLSLLVIDGVPKLWDALSEREAEDYYYLWRAFAVAMGIHPPDAEGDGVWVPATLTEAREFYASYERRHYQDDPARNADGVALATENLDMLQTMIPRVLRPFGFSRLPRVLMTTLIGDEGCRRVGLTPTKGIPILHPLLIGTMKVIARLMHVLDRLDPTGRLHPTLSRLLLQEMITREYGGIVTFRIPESLKQVQGLVAPRGGAI